MQIETLISLIPGTQTRCGNWAEVGWNLYEEPQWDQKMALGGHLNAWDVSPSQGQLHNWVPVKRPVEAGPGTPRPPRTFISPAKYRKIISHQWAQCSSPRFKANLGMTQSWIWGICFQKADAFVHILQSDSADFGNVEKRRKGKFFDIVFLCRKRTHYISRKSETM